MAFCDSVTESRLVNELRIAIGDSNIDDAELRRFLRARNHDLQKAEDMLRKSLEWRKAVKFEDALEFNISDCVKKGFPFFLDGKDRDGRMVFYFPVGRWEVRKMITAGCRSEMERYIYSTMASMVKAIDQTKHEQFIVIIDLAELSYWKVAHYETMQLVIQVFREYEQNFPERLYKAIVMNAPWVLNMIFPVIKPLLTGKTLQNVQIFDNSPDKYFPAILERVSVSGLPSGFHELNAELINSMIIPTD